MDPLKVITRLLGVQDVEVEDIKLWTKGEHRAVIQLRCKRNKSCCRKCGSHLGSLHDWQRKTVKAPPLGIFQDVKIILLVPRSFCLTCNKSQQAYVSWVHPHCSSFSCGFAEVAGRMMEETTCAATGRLLNAPPRTLWKLDQFRMQTMMERLELPKDLDVSYLSADEVHFKTKWFKERVGLSAKRWEAHFMTNLVSHKDRKVLFGALGRGSKSLKDCLSVLTEEQKEEVKYFALDMHDPFFNVVKQQCPQAEICVDRFHIVQQLNKVFDEVRKSEFKRAKKRKDIFIEGMLSPSRRFVLVEKQKHLTNHELGMLKSLRKLNINIHTAMLLVEQLHVALDKTTLKGFRDSLSVWYRVVIESKLTPFIIFAKTIRKYHKHMEAYVSSRLTTAVSEGLNNKIKTLKRMAYGYDNPISFRNKILQRCGYLNHYSINTEDYFHLC
jgi:transposase